MDYYNDPDALPWLDDPEPRYADEIDEMCNYPDLPWSDE